MDSDLSHEALQRFQAIEARLDKLEAGTTNNDSVEADTDQEIEE